MIRSITNLPTAPENRRLSLRCVFGTFVAVADCWSRDLHQRQTWQTNRPYKWPVGGSHANALLSRGTRSLGYAAVVVIIGVSVIRVRAQIPSDALAHWKLDETAGTTAADSSPNGNDGLRMNGAAPVAGRIDGAVSFDGIDDHIVVTSPNGLENSAYAISAWVKFTTTDVSGGNVGSMGDSYTLRVQPNGEVKTSFYKGNSAWTEAVSTGFSINDGNWHHVVGQYSGTKLQVYIDGTIRDDRTITDPISYTRGHEFYIGQHGFGGTNHNFNGTIDQVRVYSRALSAAEISGLAAEQPTGSTQIKVLTWNLRKGRATDDSDSIADNSIADWIKNTAQPDVLLLVAVQNQTEATAIKNRLGGTWDVYFDKASDTTEGQAILSHYPIPTGTMADGRPYRDKFEQSCPNDTENQIILKAVVSIGGADVNFFGVDHQHNGGMDRSEVRRCQAEGFSAWAAGFAAPRIIGGDFNGTPTDAGITTWISAGYGDGWVNAITRQGYPDEGSSVGNNSGNAVFGRTKSTRIDYILTSAGITPTEARVWDTRKALTTCNDVDPQDGFLTNAVCGGDCSTCTWVDDKGVRPSDHIPLRVIIPLP